MEKGSIRYMTSCDFDLHEVEEPIGARDRYASHTRRYMKLHPRFLLLVLVFFFLNLRMDDAAPLMVFFVFGEQLSGEITITRSRYMIGGID